jgi:tRNA(Ile)-lysidine synthase
LGILVGISGGADSSALLHLLAHFAGEFHYSLGAAYFDHQIRSADERAAELATVRRIAEAAGVSLHVGGAPVREHARAQKRSIEEQARIERYRFLQNAATAVDAEIVAVGHTKDDQAETVLLHVLRGSGIHGLAGMEERQQWPFGDGPTLIRPLLGFRRLETAAYCFASGIATHKDSENESIRYRRNQIRLKLLPVMEEFNPQAVEAIARLAGAAREQLQLLEGFARPHKGELQFRLDDLGAMPRAIRAEAFVTAYTALAGSRRGLTAKHLAAINALVVTTGEHSLNLPGGIEAVHGAETLRFRRSQRRILEKQRIPIPLAIPGSVRFAGWEIETAKIPASAAVPATSVSAVIAADIASIGLTVRQWRAGDRMWPAGMWGHKKLQDLFVDAKVPRSERTSIPVVCVGDEPIWAVGVRVDRRADCRDAELNRVLITAHRLDPEENATIGLARQSNSAR